MHDEIVFCKLLQNLAATKRIFCLAKYFVCLLICRMQIDKYSALKYKGIFLACKLNYLVDYWQITKTNYTISLCPVSLRFGKKIAPKQHPPQWWEKATKINFNINQFSVDFMASSEITLNTWNSTTKNSFFPKCFSKNQKW